MAPSKSKLKASTKTSSDTTADIMPETVVEKQVLEKPTKSSSKQQKTVPESTTTTTTDSVVPKTTKTTKSKKSEQVKTSTEVPSTTVTTMENAPSTTEPENIVIASDATNITQDFTEFISKFQAMISNFSSLRTELKTLERRTMKQLKVVEKLNNKKKKGAKRRPSGFVKPAPISDELAVFLGKEKGIEMARTDVTREINQYIRANSLQDKENGRKINPDNALRTLLRITPDSDVVLTYFNLQRYMGPHFPKSIKTETLATTSE